VLRGEPQSHLISLSLPSSFPRLLATPRSDDKQAVIGICEAVEHLLGAGFQPSRTLAVVFGHDEEIGGFDGAAHAYAWLEKRLREMQASGTAGTSAPPLTATAGKPVGLLLDEGLFVLSGAIPGVPPTLPTAMICTEVRRRAADCVG
jgi:hypothetical protein